MQSLSRAIGRGNAVLTFSSVYKRVEPIYKRGTSAKVWSEAIKNQLSDLQASYRLGNSKPFVRDGEKVIKRRRKR